MFTNETLDDLQSQINALTTTEIVLGGVAFVCLLILIYKIYHPLSVCFNCVWKATCVICIGIFVIMIGIIGSILYGLNNEKQSIQALLEQWAASRRRLLR